jgi:hypothetical protein
MIAQTESVGKFGRVQAARLMPRDLLLQVVWMPQGSSLGTQGMEW